MNKICNGFSTFLRRCCLALMAPFFSFFIFSSLTYADTRTLPDGLANLPGQFDTINADLSGITSADSQRLGIRLSFHKFSKHFIAFLDAQGVESSLDGIAQGNKVDVSGNVVGGGLYITDLIPDWGDYTVDLRVSAQSEDLDVDSNIVVSGIQAQTTLDNRSVSLALILSPASALFSNGANAYMTLGASYQRSQRDVVLDGQSQRSLRRYEQEYVPQLGIGLVYPYKRIAFYASAEYEQELALGLGVRLQLTRLDSQ